MILNIHKIYSALAALKVFVWAVASITFIIGVQGCANIVAPTGGGKDTTPPKVVENKSTPNFQTNFIKKRIELTFDEWIKLDDAFNQVVVSPPLNELPIVTLEGKKVVFNFGKTEELRPNATYTINFGSAVKDLAEGNIAKNMRFVFSTGPIIDSLTVRGRVVDAITAVPTEGVVVMLYDNTADSVVRKIKPFYFAKTDKNGEAIIENVREGRFKVFALLDKDLNYLYNQDGEKIGFPDSLFNITSDFTVSKLKSDTALTTQKDSTKSLKPTNNNNSRINIRLFEPLKKWQILTKETDKYGIVKLIANQDPKMAKVTFDNINQKIATETSKDTILLFYDLPSGDAPWNVYVQKDTFRTDTIRIRTKGRVDYFKKNKILAPINAQTNFSKSPAKPFTFSFANPIDAIDTQKITLLDTARKAVPLSIRFDSASKRTLIFNADFKEGIQYSLTLLPQALTDIFGLKNDTLALKITGQRKSEFGALILKIKGLDTSKQYFVEVLSGAGEVVSSFAIKNKTGVEQRVELIPPDEYKLKVIEDTNKNGRWDTGDYDHKRQPERIFWKTTERLRADWEVETELDINKIE